MIQDPNAEKVKLIFKDKKAIDFSKLKKKLKEKSEKVDLNNILLNGKCSITYLIKHFPFS